MMPSVQSPPASALQQSPSSPDDYDALAEAVQEAIDTGAVLELEPGIHYTKPGVQQIFTVGRDGFRCRGLGSTREHVIVQRPDNAVNLDRPDNNYGWFFVPDTTFTDDELDALTWNEHTNKQGHTFEFAIVRRGFVEIENLTFDCNMGKQGLEDLEKGAAEHATMLGFRGTHVKYEAGPYNDRRVFVAFEHVYVKKVETRRGGFADDIWISRGYFNPNIEYVAFQDVRSTDRVNRKRATISFSGLAQRVDISDLKVFKLEAEQALDWRTFPRSTPDFKPSIWNVKSVLAEIIDVFGKQQAIIFYGHDLHTTHNTLFSHLGGRITNSVFYKFKEPRMIRMAGCCFVDVTWVFKPDEDGEVHGLMPYGYLGNPCEVHFRRNTMWVEGAFKSGRLIRSGDYSPSDDQYVIASFHDMTYDERFGHAPGTEIARIVEKGHWEFTAADFEDRPHAIKLRTPTPPDVVVTRLADSADSAYLDQCSE